MGADTYLPLLNVVMRVKRASNESLAAASGVSARTIGSARCGKPIRSFLAELISQALYHGDFGSRKPRKLK